MSNDTSGPRGCDLLLGNLIKVHSNDGVKEYPHSAWNRIILCNGDWFQWKEGKIRDPILLTLHM